MFTAVSCAPLFLFLPPTQPGRSKLPKPKSQGQFSPTNSHFTAVVVYCFSSPPPLPQSSHPSVPPDAPVPCTVAQGENSPNVSAILQQYTLIALLSAAGLQCRPGGHLEHLPYAVLGLSGAFHVTECCDSSSHVSALLWFHWLLLDEETPRTQFRNITSLLDNQK